MGYKKLPKVKELQAEYARLLEEKKKTCAEYRYSCKKKRKLLAVKVNAEQILKDNKGDNSRTVATRE